MTNPVQAFAFFRCGTKDVGWGRISFPDVDSAIAFEQDYNAAMLPLRMHLRVAPDVPTPEKVFPATS